MVHHRRQRGIVQVSDLHPAAVQLATVRPQRGHQVEVGAEQVAPPGRAEAVRTRHA
jgi:hypothetical protein